MAFARNHLGNSGLKPSVQPLVRLVTDFTRLVTDVDGLMMEMSRTAHEGPRPAKPNGDARKLTPNGPMVVLRENTQLFLESLKNFASLLDRVPVPLMELDAKARILRTNKECAEVLNGSGSPLPGKSLFNLVAPSDTK